VCDFARWAALTNSHREDWGKKLYPGDKMYCTVGEVVKARKELEALVKKLVVENDQKMRKGPPREAKICAEHNLVKGTPEYFEFFRRNQKEMAAYLEAEAYSKHGKWKGEDMLTANGYEGDLDLVGIQTPVLHNRGAVITACLIVLQKVMEGERNIALAEKIGRMHADQAKSSVAYKHGSFNGSLKTSRQLQMELCGVREEFAACADPVVRHLGLLPVWGVQNTMFDYVPVEWSWQAAFHVRVMGALEIQTLYTGSNIVGGKKMVRKQADGTKEKNLTNNVYCQDTVCVQTVCAHIVCL